MSKNNKNKNVRVVQSNYDVELKINNFSEKFNVSHKMTKNDKLEITIKDKIKTFKLSLKETKSKIKVKQIKIVEKIESKSKETSVSLDKIEYVDDFEIKVRDFYVPVTVLINPVLELYYDIEKINTEMKANKDRMKMKKNKYVIDCSIKKEGYIVESSALSVEELEELYKENDDNKLGVYLEYLKRRHEQEDEVVENVVENVDQEVINEVAIEKLVKENVEKIEELKKKHNEEIEALNKKHAEEIKTLKDMIGKEIESTKEENKIINETSEETLIDALCAVFENAGKKDEYMKLYESSKNFNTDIIDLILTNKLSDLSLAILNDRLNDKDAKEIKDNLINKINETKEKESKSKDNECNSDETNIERLIKAAQGTFNDYDINIVKRSHLFGNKIKEMGFTPTDEEIIEVIQIYVDDYMAPIIVNDIKSVM